jgi:hypothetical protein
MHDFFMFVFVTIIKLFFVLGKNILTIFINNICVVVLDSRLQGMLVQTAQMKQQGMVLHEDKCY